MRAALAEAGEGRPGRLAARHDHRRERTPDRSLEGLLPAGVHLDQVQEGPDHPVDTGKQLGAGSPPGLVERPLERVGSCQGPGLLLLGLTQRLLGHLQPVDGIPVGRLGLGHRGLEPVAALLGLGEPFPELVLLALEQRRASFGRGQARVELVEGAPVALEGMLERGELSTGHRDRLLGASALAAVPPGCQMGLELTGDSGRGRVEDVVLRRERLCLPLGGRELLDQMSALGLEGGDHVGVGRSIERPGEGALPLPDHAGQPAGTLDHPLGPPEGGREVGLALGGEFAGGPLRVRVAAPPTRHRAWPRPPVAARGAGSPRRAGGRVRRARCRPHAGGPPAARLPARCTSGPPRLGVRADGSAA